MSLRGVERRSNLLRSTRFEIATSAFGLLAMTRTTRPNAGWYGPPLGMTCPWVFKQGDSLVEQSQGRPSSPRHLEEFAGLHQLLLVLFIESDFFVCEVAGRVRGPGVVELQIGPHSQAAAAGVEVFAEPASPFDMSPSIPNPFYQPL